jgi:hypothetical protein
VELYDHDADPGEFNNLAGNPAQAKIMAHLKSLLSGVTHDPPKASAP